MSTLLKLKKINLKYQTGKKNISVLRNIDLIIKKKETVSVVGESGSGKTSLIMLIGGLERPTSGKIIFNEKEITSLHEDEISEIRKKNIGIIFQSFYLIPNYTPKHHRAGYNNKSPPWDHRHRVQVRVPSLRQ